LDKVEQSGIRKVGLGTMGKVIDDAHGGGMTGAYEKRFCYMIGLQSKNVIHSKGKKHER
jgi:hypothetical protein